jgi:hypothetical protein
LLFESKPDLYCVVKDNVGRVLYRHGAATFDHVDESLKRRRESCEAKPPRHARE